jgi:esterase/lipase superfamily enzyme
MGARMTMETLVQLRLAGRGAVLDRIELVLAAPDIDIDLFRAQMASLGPMKHPITVLVSSDDPALKLSSRLSSRRMRLGLADVHDPAIQRLAVETGIRIVDITDIATRDPAHSRYVGLLSGEAGAMADNTLFGGMRQAGAFVFNQVGGVFNGIGGALAD